MAAVGLNHPAPLSVDLKEPAVDVTRAWTGDGEDASWRGFFCKILVGLVKEDIHTYIHTYIHTCMHACMHACMHVHKHIRTHATHKSIYIHTLQITYIHVIFTLHIVKYIYTSRICATFWKLRHGCCVSPPQNGGSPQSVLPSGWSYFDLRLAIDYFKHDSNPILLQNRCNDRTMDA